MSRSVTISRQYAAISIRSIVSWWRRAGVVVPEYVPEDVILVALEAAARVARKGLWVQAQCHRGSDEKALHSFVLRLHEGLLGHYPGYPYTYTDPGGVLCAPILVVSP